MPLPPDLASHIKQLVGSERYLDSASETASYGFNSYPMHTEPAAVVLFEERAHVERVVPMLYERGVPMVIRGSGTNVAGNALAPTGGVVLSLERMKKILELDTVSRFMRVEAGANVKTIRSEEHTSELQSPLNLVC